jgi:hypothetical protein
MLLCAICAHKIKLCAMERPCSKIDLQDAVDFPARTPDHTAHQCLTRLVLDFVVHYVDSRTWHSRIEWP